MNSTLPWIAGIVLAATSVAQRPHPMATVDWSQVENRIAWYGTLEGGRAAAKATDRPILLISGAPHCQLVPGVW